jgi:hypothetical protein
MPYEVASLSHLQGDAHSKGCKLEQTDYSLTQLASVTEGGEFLAVCTEEWGCFRKPLCLAQGSAQMLRSLLFIEAIVSG